MVMGRLNCLLNLGIFVGVKLMVICFVGNLKLLFIRVLCIFFCVFLMLVFVMLISWKVGKLLVRWIFIFIFGVVMFCFVKVLIIVIFII